MNFRINRSSLKLPYPQRFSCKHFHGLHRQVDHRRNTGQFGKICTVSENKVPVRAYLLRFDIIMLPFGKHVTVRGIVVAIRDILHMVSNIHMTDSVHTTSNLDTIASVSQDREFHVSFSHGQVREPLGGWLVM